MTDTSMPVQPRSNILGGHRIHLIENFITPEDAQALIDEQKNPSKVNPYPEYYKERFGGTAFPYNDKVMDILKKYGEMSNEVHKQQNAFYNDIYVFKAFGSWWTEGTKGDLHIDAQGPEPFIEWSTIIYLNGELSDRELDSGETISPELQYTGGKIYFPNQNYVYQPKRYSAVFFPSAGTEYIHGITRVLTGNRHTALYMHTSLPKHADPDFLVEGTTPEWKATGYILRNE